MDLIKFEKLEDLSKNRIPDSICPGNFFSTKFAQFNTEFGELLIFAIGNAYVPKILRCLIESQQQQLSSC